MLINTISVNNVYISLYVRRFINYRRLYNRYYVYVYVAAHGYFIMLKKRRLCIKGLKDYY